MSDSTEMDASLPLEGIVVVSLEQAVAAPFATRQLADLGARVIKVERVGDGDFCRGYDDSVNGLASYFVWLNRTKESLTLDVKEPRARAILESLLGQADVFVTNLSSDAVSRLGLDKTSVASRHPGVIHCAVTGYDPKSNQRSRRAYDLLIQAESGTVAVTGSATEPAKVGISIADIAAGMYAFSGVLTALFVRERTGIARAVEVNLFDALTEWASQPLYVAAGAGRNPARRGLHHASIAPYGPVETADGGIVIVAVQNPQEWRRLCTVVLGDESIADDPRFSTNVARTANRVELEERIAKVAGQLSSAELAERLERADVPYGALRTPLEALEALRDRLGPLPLVASPAGPVEVFGRPLSLENVPLALGRIPAVGEDTDAILAELGYDADAIADLHKIGAA